MHDYTKLNESYDHFSNMRSIKLEKILVLKNELQKKVWCSMELYRDHAKYHYKDLEVYFLNYST